MKMLPSGTYYGRTNSSVYIDEIMLTDTEYTCERVDWHYHENAYFTFILEGHVIEGNRKEVYDCPAGTLLFHHWQEPHYNIKPPGFTRGFHIELPRQWFEQAGINTSTLEGSHRIMIPDVKLLMYQLFSESREIDANNRLFIESLVMKAFSRMLPSGNSTRSTPSWVAKLDMILHDAPDAVFTLHDLGRELDLHPVHLCRDFSKYFRCNLGDYLRKLRIEKSCALLPNTSLSLTEIAYSCGFADQSHFTRTFRKIQGQTPSAFRKLITG